MLRAQDAIDEAARPVWLRSESKAPLSCLSVRTFFNLKARRSHVYSGIGINISVKPWVVFHQQLDSPGFLVYIDRRGTSCDLLCVLTHTPLLPLWLCGALWFALRGTPVSLSLVPFVWGNRNAPTTSLPAVPSLG